MSHTVYESRQDVAASSIAIVDGSHSHVQINFEFLATNDWIRLEVFHSAEDPSFTVKGVVIGGKSLRVERGLRQRTKNREFLWIAAVMAVSFFVNLAYDRLTDTIGGWVVLGLALGIVVALVSPLVKRPPAPPEESMNSELPRSTRQWDAEKV